MKLILSKWAFLTWLVLQTESMNIYRTNICYDAKTCIHNGREVCGKDHGGKVRKFLDSCDLLEYNCLRSTDYKRSTLSKCKNLPDIDEQNDNGTFINNDKNTESRPNEEPASYAQIGSKNVKEKQKEHGIEGPLNINDDMIEHNITINSDLEKAQEPNLTESTDEISNQKESVIEGHVEINDDPNDGQIILDSDAEETVEQKFASKNKDFQNQEISLIDDDDKIAGHMTLNSYNTKTAKVQNVYNGSNKLKGKQRVPGVEGSLNINDDEIEGLITIDSNLETAQESNLSESPDKPSNKKESVIKGHEEISKDAIEGDITLDSEKNKDLASISSESTNDTNANKLRSKAHFCRDSVNDDILLNSEEYTTIANKHKFTDNIAIKKMYYEDVAIGGYTPFRKKNQKGLKRLRMFRLKKKNEKKMKTKGS